jgi:hypothetical protein
MVRVVCGRLGLPISGVQSNGMNFDENVIVSHLRQRNVLHLSLAYTDDLDCLHGSG